MMVKAAKHILSIVPDQVGIPLVKSLSAKVALAKVRDGEKAALARAVRFKLDGVPAYSWGSGPIVLLAHGWAGRAAQMAPLALALSQAGYRAVAFDVTGHGETPGRRTSWSSFFGDLSRASAALGKPIFACVGHSAGALSLMASRGKGVSAERYVTICSPSYPFPPLDFIGRILNPSPAVMVGYQDYLAEQFATSWDVLKTGSSYAGAGTETLLIYDVGDRVVPHSEGDKLRELCPEVRMAKLGPFGHTRVLGRPELSQTIIEFLSLENGDDGSVVGLSDLALRDARGSSRGQIVAG